MGLFENQVILRLLLKLLWNLQYILSLLRDYVSLTPVWWVKADYSRNSYECIVLLRSKKIGSSTAFFDNIFLRLNQTLWVNLQGFLCPKVSSLHLSWALIPATTGKRKITFQALVSFSSLTLIVKWTYLLGHSSVWEITAGLGWLIGVAVWVLWN